MRAPDTLPMGVEEAEALAAKPVELASFSGGDSFGMIARFAACLEQDGRRPALRWTRDERGIISGLAVVECPSTNTHGVAS